VTPYYDSPLEDHPYGERGVRPCPHAGALERIRRRGVKTNIPTTVKMLANERSRRGD